MVLRKYRLNKVHLNKSLDRRQTNKDFPQLQNDINMYLGQVKIDRGTQRRSLHVPMTVFSGRGNPLEKKHQDLHSSMHVVFPKL